MATAVSNGKQKARVVVVEEVTNAAEDMLLPPYRVKVTVEGTARLLFHRWNCDAVEEKANAAKGSKTKKSDNLETYVYRNEKGNICLPGEYLRMACVWASKFRQDPRSPRKSAMDLYKAGLICETELAEIKLGDQTLRDWTNIDRRRACIQRSAITRERPAIETGWRSTFQFLVLTPEYIASQDIHSVLTQAGQLIGVGDFRPTYGRFQVIRFEVL